MVFGSNNGIYRSALAAVAGLIFVAMSLGLGAFIGALYAPYYGELAERTAVSATPLQMHSSSQLDRNRAGLPYIAEKLASASDPESVDEREKRDLAAQEAAALWSFWILVVSFMGTLITMIGTGLLLWQIILTRRAVNVTVQSAEAMRAANEIAAAANRAWIDIIPELEVRKLDNGNIYLKAHTTFKNIGKSVATNVQTMSRFRTGSFGDGIQSQNEMFRKMMRSDGGMTMMPGKSRSGGQTTNGFTKEQVNWDENGKAAFYLVTVAVYNIEGVSRKHYSRGTWFYRPEGNEFVAGASGLTWSDFVDSAIEVDPQSSSAFI